MFKRLGTSWPSSFDLRLATGFLSRLPGYLRHKMDPLAAAGVIAKNIRSRESDFILKIQHEVLAYPQSAYSRLLDWAGLDLAELKRLVQLEGLDGTLQAMMKAGVYLSVDEFKGRKEVQRGSLRFETGPIALQNPRSGSHIPITSSGSRTKGGTPMIIDLAYVADCAVDRCHYLGLHGGQNWRKAKWGVPGSMAMIHVLEFSYFGKPAVKWFSQLDAGSKELHPRYKFSGLGMHWVSRLSGVPLPKPEHVPLDNPLPIAQWMKATLEKGEVPCIHTYASSAVRICRAAMGEGISLKGAKMLISGEPITRARVAVIRSTGADVMSRYGSAEAGAIAYGCMGEGGPSDMHFLGDLHAIIQAGEYGNQMGVPPEALYITVLRPTAPFTMINVSLGDRAELSSDDCGCPMYDRFWPQKLKSIRSFEKLTGAGMAFLDTDVIRVLEEVLPGHFGGTATDYQLVEKESSQGEPRLHILIRPDLGELDHEAVKQVFMEALSSGSGVSRIMGMTWQEAGILRVERRNPYTTASGKIQHLHLDKSAGT